ncbi:hypothetical protein RQP46_009880 [Phenoliferia psychrophenolica]
MAKPIAAVVASTGTSGFSVVKALAAKGYHVRALTRSPTGEKTVAKFAPLGPNVEPFHFDVSDAESIKMALEGAEVVFAVSIPEDDKLEAAPGSPESRYEGPNETEQGVAFAEAASAAGVKRYIWSTLDDPVLPYREEYGEIKTFSEKAAVNHRVIALDLPAVMIHQGYFMDNISNFDWAVVKDDGSISLVVPHMQENGECLPLISVAHDTGSVVSLLLDHYDSHNLKHKAFNLAHGLYSGGFIAQTIREESGREVTIDSPRVFGVIGSDYDKLQKFICDPKTVYFPAGEVPDPTLKSLGFVFQDFKGFVRETLLPKLGIEPVPLK